MFTSSEYRRIARDKLKGNWWSAILVSFVAVLLGANGSNGGGGFNGANTGYNAGAAQGQEINSIGDIFEAMANSLSHTLGVNITAALLVTIITSAAIISLVLYIVGGAIELGHDRYYIELVGENRANKLSILFSRFDIFGKALWLRIYMGLKVFAWTLLFIVPGIIAAYRYALAPYIMAEDPTISAHDAVERSKALMAGHKGRLFCLGFSFIGWAILCAFTLGIGSLWLTPYTNAATAAFYYDRTGRSIPMAGATGTKDATGTEDTTAE